MFCLCKNLTLILVFTISWQLFSQIPNAGFEQWSAGNPGDWFCSNLPPFGTPVTQISPGYSGTWAVRGEVITNTLGDTMPPLLTSGLSAQGFPITTRYNELNGFYKFSPMGGDLLLIGVLMYKSNISVGSGVALISAGTSTFTQFTVPINYSPSGTPDRCVIQFAISNSQPVFHPGSYFILDDLSFSVSTRIEEEPLAEIPGEFELFQNYPNPFNPATNIRYGIPQVSFVNIEVYNSLGQKVAELVNEQKAAGEYEVAFDASQLPGGVYFYQIHAGSYQKVMKMMLMK